MKDLFFFDADCQVGSVPTAGVLPGVPELLVDMDKFGVEKALVAHGNAPMLGAVQSNKELSEMLKADTDSRLHGVWSILPTQCPELPPAEKFFELLEENRISALTLYPFDHLFVPRRRVIGKLMDMAAEKNIPVMLKAFSNRGEDLYDFVEEFPDNRMILCEKFGKWGHDRQIRPLLENFPGFYFGLTGYWVPEGIRDLVEFCGAERLLFASGFPGYSQGSLMLQLKHSGLSDGDLRLIAGENMARLLSEVKE